MDFFEEHHNTLDEDFCKHVIEKFENDSNSFPGETGEGVNTEIKDSRHLIFKNIIMTEFGVLMFSHMILVIKYKERHQNKQDMCGTMTQYHH
jgi:hypothetical protein